ncbi:MAG: GNAT family N-acetyltransferase [Actinobacteria bacterium]|nr:GNAT family N-acetyltransferase [Actinomycetota bacterium]
MHRCGYRPDRSALRTHPAGAAQRQDLRSVQWRPAHAVPRLAAAAVRDPHICLHPLVDRAGGRLLVAVRRARIPHRPRRLRWRLVEPRPTDPSGMNAGFVRPARSHDADAIVSVALAAWRNLPWLSLDEDSNVVAAVRADWQSLLGRTTSQAPATSTAPADADSASAIAPVPDAAVLVATQSDDVLVGWLLLGAPEDGFPGGVCEVLDVVVAPSSQRQAHGSRLMHAAADTARERGVAWLSAWCPLPVTRPMSSQRAISRST